ncbi:MAG: chemotaxis response regulator protein-glutamate methylesterase [Verrucomicrobiota bacterium]
MNTHKKIKVLIVDDSAVVRRMTSEVLGSDPEIEVIGTALDPYIAREIMLKNNPDVLTLDIEMPRMDGLTFLKIIMEKRPMPVIIMSSLTQQGSEHALKALQLGAIDIMPKPDGSFSVGALKETLIDKVKAAATARMSAHRGLMGKKPSTPSAQTSRVNLSNAQNSTQALQPSRQTSSVNLSSASRPAAATTPNQFNSKQIILIGSSTGGTEALREVLTRMPASIPPIAIVQHIPPYFSNALANRLNGICPFEVREAKDNDKLHAGLVLIAPGDYHMLLQWKNNSYSVQLKQGAPVWHQRPAVDILFASAVNCNPEHSVATVLTGMGKDGADGLLKLKNAGCMTFAEHEDSCIVYGMPRVAKEIGAAKEMVHLDNMASRLMHAVSRKKAVA